MYGRVNNLMPAMMTSLLDAGIQEHLDADNGWVVTYPGQGGVIAFNITTSNYFTNLIQPRLETSDGLDLTGLAVFIGSYGCKLMNSFSKQ